MLSSFSTGAMGMCELNVTSWLVTKVQWEKSQEFYLFVSFKRNSVYTVSLIRRSSAHLLVHPNRSHGFYSPFGYHSNFYSQTCITHANPRAKCGEYYFLSSLSYRTKKNVCIDSSQCIHLSQSVSAATWP